MRRYRAFLVPVIGLVVVLGGFLAFNLKDNLVYYQTPSEATERRADFADRRFRLGGQVVPGSVTDSAGEVSFLVTDGIDTIPVVHRGAPQQLFQEGIGVVVEGVWEREVFRSDTMIIKHDEQYRTDDGGVYTPEQRFPTP